MIFSDVEDTTYVAFYNVIQNVMKRGYIYEHIYTMIPLLIDANNIDEAREIAKSKCNRHLTLDEIREINMKDKNNILNFYK